MFVYLEDPRVANTSAISVQKYRVSVSKSFVLRLNAWRAGDNVPRSVTSGGELVEGDDGSIQVLHRISAQDHGLCVSTGDLRDEPLIKSEGRDSPSIVDSLSF